MESRVAGIFRIQRELLNNASSGAVASMPSSSLNKDEALLWQLNAFVQAERKHFPKDVDGVFHAKKTEHKNADGTEVSRIDLYIRPKAHGIFSFFDSVIYGKDQKLAADILVPLINRAPTACPSANSASVPHYPAPSNRSRAQQASVQVNSIASTLKAIAGCITADKLKPPGNNDPLVKQGSLQDAVRAQPEFSQWDANVNTLSDSDLRKNLEGFGFKSEGITTFETVANDIAQRNDTGNVDMAALNEFRVQWVATCERADAFGAQFRKAVCENSKFRAWNVLAHHLGGQPQFDLRFYANYTRVMVPHTTNLIWSELVGDHGSTYAMVKALHTKASQQGTSEFEQSADKKHQLFAAKPILFDEKATALSLSDKFYLEHKYESFITPSIASNEPFLLTPLFHHNEQTIQACVDIMLKPVKKALDNNQALPDIGIFSTDPRISTKFNEELDKLKIQAQLRKIRAAIQQPTYPTLESKVPEPVVIPTLTANPTQTLKVQVGITEDHWYPNDKTLLLLTSSSRDCVLQKEVSIAIELNQMLESEEFSATQESSAIFSTKQKPLSVGSAARYVAPVKEVAMDENKWFFSAAALDESKAKEIQTAYKKVCEDAETAGIHKLVMTPCFREVGKTMLGNNQPYRDAVGVMVATLAQLFRAHPTLELTMVARSEDERILMQEAMKHQGMAVD